ncbi:MAG: hypothetical protein LKG27_02750 [Clostridiaceae bacterium]|jgi:hypothetical protein|nr:hypothetical protein [Clostridiaceae bacterium]
MSNLMVSNVNSMPNISQLSSVRRSTPFTGHSKHCDSCDAFERTDNECGRSANMTTEEKQDLIKSARNKAAGWTIFGGVFSTLYYACRSNNTVAEKYGLDPKKDKELVQQIKHTQTVWTLPGSIFGVGVISWIVSKCCSARDIDV